MKRAATPPARNRPRKKAAASETAAPVESADLVAADAPAESSDARNVGSLEGVLSMGIGILLVVAALLPRSIRQVLMLTLGGGLLYRGMTGHSGVYRAMGIDTAKEPPLPQPGGKL